MRIGVLLVLAVIMSPPLVYAPPIHPNSPPPQTETNALGPDPADIVRTGCEYVGGPCTLTVVSLSGADRSSWTYSWSVSGPAAVPGGSGPTYSPAFNAPGTYTITVNVSNTYGDAQKSIVITVVASPCTSNPTEANTGITFLGGGPSGCNGPGSTCSIDEPITFSVSPYGWTFAACDKYTWDFGDGTTSTAKFPTKRYASAGTYAVRLKLEGGLSTANVSISIKVDGPCPPMSANSNVYIYFVGPTTGCTPISGNCISAERLQFEARTYNYNFSCGTHSFAWNFGDGTTSTLQNPTKAYTTDGSYTVSLTITSPVGQVTMTWPIRIGVATSTPVALFAFAPVWPLVDQEVAFTDLSTGSPTQWLWNFEDGETSGAQHPTHKFRLPGRYAVTLTASNAAGSSSKIEMLTVTQPQPPVAAFSFSPMEPEIGSEVRFIDESSGGATAWAWDFGDGSASSVQHPTHVFDSPGRTTVRLTVGNEHGSNSATEEITVKPAPDLRLVIAPTNPTTDETVRFSATTAGRVSDHQWEFGDGNRSDSPAPLHVFTAPGEYACSLLALRDGSPVFASRSITVRPSTQPPVASFVVAPARLLANVPVEFIDTSTGGTTSWIWSFGDGTTATGRTVKHVFAAAGSFAVKLVTANRYGASTAEKVLVVNGTSKRRATRR